MTTDKQPETTDIFQLMNQLDGVANDLHLELFLFNKNGTPYATRISDAVKDTLGRYFVLEFMNAVQLGAGTGLTVRDINFESDNTNVLIREDLSKVSRADNLIHWIENERDDMVYFDEAEHDFKRMKGFVVRVTHKTKRNIKCHFVKLVEQNKAVTGDALQFNEDLIEPMEPKAVFKLPADNQVLIVNGDIFTFNQSKFEKLFNYDHVKFNQADKKAAEFVKKFKISVASDTGNDLGNILRESPSLMNKFLKTDLDLVSPAKIVDLADEMQLELMTDDEGAIIIMEKRDLNVLLDIINDNYFESSVTGNHYVAKSKKAIQVAGE